MPRLRPLRDPFWDMDGRGVRRGRRRDRIVGSTALTVATLAVALTALEWVRQLGPILRAVQLT